jgi:hypothetical protein
LAAIAALLFVLIALTQQRPVEHLKEVYTPSFSRVPPAPAVGHELSQLWLDLKSPSGQTFLRRLLPSQGGVLWLSLIVALVIAFDFEHLRNPRNIDVIVMQAIGLTMFEIVRFLRLLGNGVYVELMDWVFVTAC